MFNLEVQNDRKIKIAAIFNTMRILKKINQGDMYMEAYRGHLDRHGDEFYDTYILMWELAAYHTPRRILEVGTRTGISLCQLLSGYIDHSVIERIVTVDIFTDGFISPAIVKRNLSYLNLPVDKVDIKTGNSLDILPELAEKGEIFDYILIDGDHSKETARKDLENANNLIMPGGFILFDDISDAPGECALIDVWQAFEESHKDEYTIFTNMTGKGVGLAIKK